MRRQNRYPLGKVNGGKANGRGRCKTEVELGKGRVIENRIKSFSYYSVFLIARSEGDGKKQESIGEGKRRER